MFILSLVWGTLSEVHFSLEARVNSVLIFFCTADGAKLLDFEGEKHKRLPRNRYWFSSRIISHSIILAENSLSLLLSATVLLRLNFGGRFIISSDIPIDRDVVWLQTLRLFSCRVESNWKLALLVILWTMLEVLDLPLAMRELVSGKQQMRKRIKST